MYLASWSTWSKENAVRAGRERFLYNKPRSPASAGRRGRTALSLLEGYGDGLVEGEVIYTCGTRDGEARENTVAPPEATAQEDAPTQRRNLKRPPFTRLAADKGRGEGRRAPLAV